MSIAQGNTTVNTTFADGLRALADLVDEHSCAGNDWDEYRHLIFVDDRKQMREIIQTLGGRWEKDANAADYFGVTRDLGGGVTIYVYAGRSAVCERVVLGTETVEIPDPDARVPTKTVEREVIEWRCPPTILAEARS